MSNENIKLEPSRIEELMTVGEDYSQTKDGSVFVQSLIQQVTDLEVRLKDQERLIVDLERDARTDPLTGLVNRRVFEMELKRSLAAARRYKRQSALLMIDLNGFKSVNDQLGHQVGDDVLVHVANLLKQNTRPTDVVARLGGDEFCVVLNEVRSQSDTETRAQALIDVINQSLCVVAQRYIQISASIGSYTFGEGDSVDDIVRVADERMYAQKQASSNSGDA